MPQTLALRIAIYIVVFIIFLSLFQFILTIHPFRFYSKETPQTYDIPYETVSFMTEDGLQLKGWLIESKKANGTVIVGHGYPFDKGNIFPVARFLYPQYNVLLYDHRYFGESEGKITTVGIKETKDVESAIEFIQEKYPNKPIALYGFSLSGSSMLLAKPDVTAIVADSAYADLHRMTKHIYKLFGPLKFPFVWLSELYGRIVFGVSLKKVSPANAMRDYDVPILVIGWMLIFG